MTPAREKMAHIPAMNAQVTSEMRAHHFVLQNADFSSLLQSLTKLNKSLVKPRALKITLIWAFGS